MATSIFQKLAAIQQELKAPKAQYNKFGNYHYRKAEDIMEAVKPLLAKYGCTLTCSDELVCIGERYYVKAIAVLHSIEGGDEVYTTAFAREEEDKKGMDGSQITGASSSYARKYALNGLFCIDDTQDSDTTNTGDDGKGKPSGTTKPVKKASTPAPAPASAPENKAEASPIFGLTKTQYDKYVDMAAKGIPTSGGIPVLDAIKNNLHPDDKQIKEFNEQVFRVRLDLGI